MSLATNSLTAGENNTYQGPVNHVSGSFIQAIYNVPDPNGILPSLQPLDHMEASARVINQHRNLPATITLITHDPISRPLPLSSFIYCVNLLCEQAKGAIAASLMVRDLANSEAMADGHALFPYKCYSGTRTHHRAHIITWLRSMGSKICFLRGPIGVGKTALCLSTSEHLYGLRGGGAYFAQEGSTPELSFLELPATLSYGLSRVFPRFSHFVNLRLRGYSIAEYKNLNFNGRWELLLAEPLRDVVEDGSIPSEPFLLVIDGVDAWNSKKYWSPLLDRIRYICAESHLIVVWLVSFRSRFQLEASIITSNFGQLFTPHHVTLGDDLETRADIEHYTRECLKWSSRIVESEIPEQPPCLTTPLPMSTSQSSTTTLSDASIMDLIHRANGQFAFTEDTMEFVAEPLGEPEKRYGNLCDIGKRELQAEVYRRLDGLYLSAMHAAVAISSDKAMLRTFLYHLLYEDPESMGSSIEAVANSRGLNKAALQSAIRPLVGHILACNLPLNNSQTIKLHHSSFKDFITSPLRSHSHAIEKDFTSSASQVKVDDPLSINIPPFQSDTDEIRSEAPRKGLPKLKLPRILRIGHSLKYRSLPSISSMHIFDRS